MDPALAAIIIEVSKGLIMLAFQQMRLAGMTQEEIKQYADEINTQFMALPSAQNLPDPPNP